LLTITVMLKNPLVEAKLKAKGTTKVKEKA
jgi:hypothetical protein